MKIFRCWKYKTGHLFGFCWSDYCLLGVWIYLHNHFSWQSGLYSRSYLRCKVTFVLNYYFFFKALPQDDKILIAAYFIGLIRMITGDACDRLRLNFFKLLPFWPISFVRKYSTFFSEMNGQASFMSSSSTLLFSCLVFFFQFTPRTSGGFCLMEVDSEQWFTSIFCLLALKSVSTFSDTL